MDAAGKYLACVAGCEDGDSGIYDFFQPLPVGGEDFDDTALIVFAHGAQIYHVHIVFNKIGLFEKGSINEGSFRQRGFQVFCVLRITI